MAFIALPIAIVVNPRPCTKRTALLCPKKTKSALKKLRDDINGCPELVEALKKSATVTAILPARYARLPNTYVWTKKTFFL